jgi:hypothetical protein
MNLRFTRISTTPVFVRLGMGYFCSLLVQFGIADVSQWRQISDAEPPLNLKAMYGHKVEQNFSSSF